MRFFLNIAMGGFLILGLIVIIAIYMGDCRDIGKANLAVPLSERLGLYFIMFVFPVLIVLLKEYFNF